MRASAKTFYSIGAYIFVALLAYVFGTAFMDNDGSMIGPEYVGIVALTLSFLFCLMLGGYFHITSKGIDVLPEDWEEAEVEDAQGIYGFFAPSSIWPFAMTASIAVLGYGIVFFYLWMIALGAVMLLWSTTMLSLQYGLPKEKH
ncbi:cytochrome c oxidase subunit 4 [Corynebacterium sp. L4756]|uniref:aa3-type cytochrome oxidase subunit IV n=1 Tax=unclassified Corynebacterium TaxID=2624378 RepID=UPI00374D1B6F